MIEQEQRDAVVAEARTWLRTPFRDQADVKGSGADCAMLLIRCFVDTGVLPPFDPRPYPPRWHLHQGEERFLGWIEKFGVQTDEIRPGNVAVYKEGRCFSHGALIVDPQNVIHAYWLTRRVEMTEIFDSGLTHTRRNKPRERRIYDMWAARR